MRRLPPNVVSPLLSATLCLPLLFGHPTFAQTSAGEISVQQIRVLSGKDAVEIEVEASDRVVPQTQLLSGPDRLVVDFPNAVPGAGLRSQSVEQGEVKDVRFGLFQNKPPVTRLVLDLKSAQAFQVFPGRTVIIKIGGATEAVNDSVPQPAVRPGIVAANYTTRAERIPVETPLRPAVQQSSQPISQTTAKPLQVSFGNGLLAIKSDKATLSEILFAVQQRTGAEIGIVAGAEQEKVVVDLGPAPAPEVLAQLLNGSKFNFLIVSAPDNPQRLQRVILSPRVEGMVVSRSPSPAPSPAASPVAKNVAADIVADDDDWKPNAPPPPPNARPQAQTGPDPRDVRPENDPGSEPGPQ